MCRRITEPRNGKLPAPDYHRFLSKAVCMLDTMCWEWTAKSFSTGYGKISIANGKKMMFAHRYSYLLYNGPLEDGMVVMHLCDNRKCVNPAHLMLGTYSDNTQDMYNKKRDSQRQARRKLTDAQVTEIRSRWKFRDITHAMLATEYGVSRTVIAKAVNGSTYRVAIDKSAR